MTSHSALIFPQAKRTLNEIFHLGSMDKSQKSGFSLEGSGLSVSLHPLAWKSIARLGGKALWKLSKADPVFIEAYQLNSAHLEEVERYAVEAGWITVGTTYRVTSEDENEREIYSDYLTLEEAQKESDDPDTQISINPRGLIPTTLLHELTEQTRIDLGMVDDLLLTVYAENVLQADGLWWNERLDIHSLSAPRGVLFNSKIATWTALEVEPGTGPVRERLVSFEPLRCEQCGQPLSIENGISTHLTHEGDIDYEANANHVAYVLECE